MRDIIEIKAWQLYLITVLAVLQLILILVAGQVVHRPIQVVQAKPAPSPSATTKPTVKAKPTVKPTPRVKATSRSFVRPATTKYTGTFTARTPSMRYAVTLTPPAQWPCLYKLWMRESGWSPRSRTGSHLGIAQLRGETSTDAFTQVDHGLRYIEHRYGVPCGAWAHSQAVGWY